MATMAKMNTLSNIVSEICGNLRTSANGFIYLAKLRRSMRQSMSRYDYRTAQISLCECTVSHTNSIGDRNRMSKTELKHPGRYCPGSPQTRFVASRFNVRFYESTDKVSRLIDIPRHEIFDDQARKQFINRSPNCNPFGSGETPLSFNDFDVFTKVCANSSLGLCVATEK